MTAELDDGYYLKYSVCHKGVGFGGNGASCSREGKDLVYKKQKKGIDTMSVLLLCVARREQKCRDEGRTKERQRIQSVRYNVCFYRIGIVE